jgi:hypothetical protein
MTIKKKPTIADPVLCSDADALINGRMAVENLAIQLEVAARELIAKAKSIRSEWNTFERLYKETESLSNGSAQ